jgi:SAM-dependent methyltransferase
MAGFVDHIELFRCPRCSADLELSADSLKCVGCSREFTVDDEVPLLFWPSDDAEADADLTEIVKSFYEETPFPDYNDFDSVGMLAARAREGVFARMLDEQIPPGARIIECGCGTGQLSNFLSIANRTVFATDMCLPSIRLGQRFARDQGLERVHFVQQNLFRTAFKPGSFDLVISNGVLLTTFDPFLGFKSISELVRPGGYILIGLYHRYGRLVTDLRRLIFRLTGDRLVWLDPNMRDPSWSEARKRAWFADQYKHPNETKHTIGQILRWFKETGFHFVKSLPRSRLFQPITEEDRLFEPEAPGNALERLLVELGMFFKGSKEGGFFTMIGHRN